MILGYSEGVGGCQVGCVGAPVTRKVCRAGQSGLHHALIADTVHTAVLGELAVVDREDDTAFDPAPSAAAAHLASARSISRSSCMICSANSIWRAKSGS